MFKRFLEWIGLKEKLHRQNYEPPLFKENKILNMFEASSVKEAFVALHIT